MKVKTYDILNAGPRNRFLANGRIVSNSSRGIQLQNLKNANTIDYVLDAMNEIIGGANIEHIRTMYGSPLVVASEIVRPTLIAAPNHWLARGDYTQIEDRINNWYAGQTDQLEAFRKYDRKEGPDPYRVTAGAIFNIDPLSMDKNDVRRRTGKVARLACGFGGGRGAILRMAKIQNVDMTEDRAEEIKMLWRENNKGIVKFWRDLEDGAVKAMQSSVGTRITIRPGLQFIRGSRVLMVRLPSRLTLTYWYPKIKRKTIPAGKTYSAFDVDAVSFWAEDPVKKKWTKFYLYGGLICENVVQATSRCITAESLLRLESNGYRPVLSVHDENVCEIPFSICPTEQEAADAVRNTMLISEAWADGIPINVDASAGPRYVKG